MCLVAIQIPRRYVQVVRTGSGSDFASQSLSWEMMRGASSDKSASRLIGPAYARGLATISRLFGSLAPTF